MGDNDLFGGFIPTIAVAESRNLPAKIENPAASITQLYEEWYKLRETKAELQWKGSVLDNILVPTLEGTQAKLQAIAGASAKQIEGGQQTALQRTSSVKELQLAGNQRLKEGYNAIDTRADAIKSEIGQVVENYILTGDFGVKLTLYISDNSERGALFFKEFKPMDRMAMFYLFTGQVPAINMLPKYDGICGLAHELKKSISGIGRDLNRGREFPTGVFVDNVQKYFPEVQLDTYVDSMGALLATDNQKSKAYFVSTSLGHNSGQQPVCGVGTNWRMIVEGRVNPNAFYKFPAREG
jgi:hypothetical protein